MFRPIILFITIMLRPIILFITIMFRPIILHALKDSLDYLVSQSFDFEDTLCKLFQKHHVCTNFDI
jgi:hypothetical protein